MGSACALCTLKYTYARILSLQAPSNLSLVQPEGTVPGLRCTEGARLPCDGGPGKPRTALCAVITGKASVSQVAQSDTTEVT